MVMSDTHHKLVTARPRPVEVDQSGCAAYLSASLIPSIDALTTDFQRQACFVYKWALPSENATRASWARRWMENRDIALVDEALQANTLFAAMITSDAVKHLRGFFQRDYFLEKIEHMADRAIPVHAYHRITLGRDQRFGSKGVSIVRFNDESGQLIPLVPRLIPNLANDL